MVYPHSQQSSRCFGNNNPLYAAYHDKEWGVPSYDDRHLFEMLILEGAQAGLSWETILKKREGYRQVFHNFEEVKVAAMKDSDLEGLCRDPRIIRNRRKIYATRQNARVFVETQKEFGSFSTYLWQFVKGAPLKRFRQQLADIPNQTPESEALSKDLRKRGMTFVGPTIIYAYMQAVGIVNDHLISCPCYKE